jgi:hypothetical protein
VVTLGPSRGQRERTKGKERAEDWINPEREFWADKDGEREGGKGKKEQGWEKETRRSERRWRKIIRSQAANYAQPGKGGDGKMQLPKRRKSRK